ncbi:uncharacterized protein [Elaeis guineensis]|uniref:Uncharacterized protein LOC105059810 n=1 Tax=Elaeis guineensis var. tenera TaxID=51953 RepID=A0A6I9SL10_ELAGV|nr:uncharacterized protein LOC105059810 [Elaeis guineensis]
MPRPPDIGWQHGTMIGGHRHHVQCNYCHRTMIGGITRFKKHLASKRGEIKGCEAVPKEVRETIRKHLATLKPRRPSKKKLRRIEEGAILVPISTNGNMETDASDPDETNTRQELLTLQEAEIHSPKSSDQQFIVGTREFFDAFSTISCKDEQGLAPPRATDLGWAHGMMVNGDRQKIQCKYCLKVILGGGISRLKQHLAGERGNIAPCEKVPDDIRTQMQQHLGFKVLERLKKQKDSEAVTSSTQQSRDGYDSEILNAISTREGSGERRGKEVDEGSPNKRKRIKKLHIPQASTIALATVQHTFASQESIDHADIAVAKFMYDTGIPFNAANSIYFQRMADAIATAGPGYKMPSYHSLRGKLLNRCVHEVGDICNELRKSWEVTGCTVMADRWMDKTSRVVINFFIYCPKGTMFLKSVDASDIENTSEGLLSLFDSIVQDVGPRNVVNFITDSAPCYKAAGRALMKKYKTFFWSVCANHCIELMLKGLGEMDEVNGLLAKAKKICQLTYNSAWVLNLLREKTEGRDLIQHAMTEFVMNFLTLQNIVSVRDSLQQIFTSTNWEQSSLSKQRVGMDVMRIVLDPQFWESCTKIMKVSKPLITVLNLLDSRERPSMGYLHDSMEKAKKEIISAFDNKESDYLPYLEVIGHVRDELHSPLYAAAYYLNPSIYFSPTFSINNVIQKGLLDCIETLEPDLTAQDNITKHKAFYEDAVGDFSRPVALRGRESLSPATWWSLYASDYPDLQRFAVRILSQTCSITTSDRTVTMNESVHSSKNRLEQERLNDLALVHYNLRLQERQPLALVSKALPRGEDDPVCSEGRIHNAGAWIVDPEVLEGGGINRMDVALPSDPAPAREVSNSGNGNLGDDDGGANECNKGDGSVDS